MKPSTCRCASVTGAGRAPRDQLAIQRRRSFRTERRRTHRPSSRWTAMPDSWQTASRKASEAYREPWSEWWTMRPRGGGVRRLSSAWPRPARSACASPWPSRQPGGSECRAPRPDTASAPTWAHSDVGNPQLTRLCDREVSVTRSGAGRAAVSVLLAAVLSAARRVLDPPPLHQPPKALPAHPRSPGSERRGASVPGRAMGLRSLLCWHPQLTRLCDREVSVTRSGAGRAAVSVLLAAVLSAARRVLDPPPLHQPPKALPAHPRSPGSERRGASVPGRAMGLRSLLHQTPCGDRSPTYLARVVQPPPAAHSHRAPYFLPVTCGGADHRCCWNAQVVALPLHRQSSDRSATAR